MNGQEARLLAELDGGVPAWQAIITSRGGPSEADWRWCREIFLPRLAGGGEALLYGGAERERLSTELARALALLSFAPGGVTFGGRRWVGE